MEDAFEDDFSALPEALPALKQLTALVRARSGRLH